MGTYSESLVVPAFPTKLQKLVTAITVVYPVEAPILSLRLELRKDDAVLSVHDIDGGWLREAAEEPNISPMGRIFRGRSLRHIFVLNDILLNEHCIYRAVAVTDKGELWAPGLSIDVPISF